MAVVVARQGDDRVHPGIRTQYAAFTNQGFLLRETVAAASMIQSGATIEDVQRAVRDEDLFQLRTNASRKTIGAAVVARLEDVGPTLLMLLVDGSPVVRRLTNIYLILLQHRLLRELIGSVLVEARRRLAATISGAEVNAFLEQKRTEESTVGVWSSETLQKSRSNMLSVCVAAGLLEGLERKSFTLRAQWVPKQLRDELAAVHRSSFLPLLLDSEVV